jgi:hypothetical protein
MEAVLVAVAVAAVVLGLFVALAVILNNPRHHAIPHAESRSSMTTKRRRNKGIAKKSTRAPRPKS